MKLTICCLVATIALFGVVSPSAAQTPQPLPPLPTHGPPQHNQLGGDPIRQLNLTPEQRERIRTIREEGREERTRINERLRESNRALEAALESDDPNEAVVEERVKEVVAAQSAAMRQRILTEVRIRRVLTAEQKALLRTLRLHAQEKRHERQLDRLGERERRRDRRPFRMGRPQVEAGPEAAPAQTQKPTRP